MVIAISTDGDFVSGHFGRCPGFTLATIINNELTEKTFIANPGHHPGFLPKFLNEKGVECIIAGGMGGSAIQLFNEFNIRQITGVSGKIDDVIQTFISGKLVNGISSCDSGSGKGYGVEKTVCDNGNGNSHGHTHGKSHCEH